MMSLYPDVGITRVTCIEYLESKNSIESEIDWKGIWQNFKKNAGSRCRSLQSSREWVFDTKCLNDLLPTLSLLNKKNPMMYLIDTCIACFREKEDLEHLASCELYEILWKKIERKAANLALEERLLARKER